MKRDGQPTVKTNGQLCEELGWLGSPSMYRGEPTLLSHSHN